MDAKLTLSYKCAVCKSPLNLFNETLTRQCHFCGVPFATIVTCEIGHFVCPVCADINADPSEFDDVEEYEKVRISALSKYDDRAAYVGAIMIQLLTSTPPDRKDELENLYDVEDDLS